jgi:preprotein translocase subunit SecG
MNILGFQYLNLAINALLVVFVLACLLMILLVLMQRPKQEGLGAAFGANTTDQLFGARTTNVLQRVTVYLASTFFIAALVLAVLMQIKNLRKRSSIDLTAPKVEEVKPAIVEAPKPEVAPAAPQLPTPTTSSISAAEIPTLPVAPVVTHPTIEHTVVPTQPVETTAQDKKEVK